MPAKTLVRLAGGLSIALTLQLSVPAFAQMGQSDWIRPDGSSSDAGSSSHIFGKHKKQVAATPGQSGWITPGSSLGSDSNVMLNAGGSGADMLEGAVTQSQYTPQPMQQPSMQQPSMQQPVMQQQMMVPAQQQAMMVPAQQQTMVPAQQQMMMMPVQQQMMMVPVQQQMMVPVQQQAMMVPAQQQMMMVPAQQPVMMVPVQTQAVLVPVQMAGSAQAQAQPAAKSDDSLASVVFGASKGSGDASGDSVSKALATAAEVGMIGSSLGSTVGPMLQGMGFDNHFHTFGPANCGTFYADGHGPRGNYTTNGGGLSGVGNNLINGVERGVNYGATEGSWLLMNKLMSGR